jgi:hypothetical protein
VGAQPQLSNSSPRAGFQQAVRISLVIAAATAAALATVVPAGATGEHFGCRQANGPTGIPRHPIGPLAAIGGVAYYADPAAFEHYRMPDGRYGTKAPPAVRRGRTVTISIARRDRDIAEISLSGPHADSFRLTACRHRPWSAWAGGFQLKHATCLHVVARERGSRRVYRTVLSFGMGDSCG